MFRNSAQCLRFYLFGLIGILLVSNVAHAQVDYSTLTGKVMVGYQGWHWCNGDGSSRNRWNHWSDSSTERPGPSSCTIDMYPDMSEYTRQYNTNFRRNGLTLNVYSAQDYQTVETHFRWMKEYNIDGAFVQRFLSAVDSGGSTEDNINAVMQHCKNAAQAHGRAYVLMYDVSGGVASDPENDLVNDLNQCVNAGYLNSPNYLRHNGKKLIVVWGMGFNDRNPSNPNDALSIINRLKGMGYTVMGGVPHTWRTLVAPSRTDSAWLNVYEAYDIISPWTVGTMGNLADVDTAKNTRLDPDIAYINTLNPKPDYLPVGFPGFSWKNLKGGSEVINKIPRLGGQFLWQQAYNAKTAGANMMYLAMFDEVDEATALYKTAPTMQQCPDTLEWVPLNIDGYNLPSDWYLQVSGQINEMFKDEITPVKDLPLLEAFQPPAVTLSGSPVGNVTNQPFTVTLTVNDDFGYYSVDGAPYTQFPASTPAQVNITGPSTLSYYGQGANGTSPTESIVYTFDTVMPNISMIIGPDYDFMSPDPFDVTLEIDEEWGYWSLNGGPYNQFGLEPVVVNPLGDMETGSGSNTTGWNQNASHSRSTDLVKNGSWALKSTYRGALGLASSTVVSVTPNTDYTFSAWIWKDDNNGAAYIDLSDIPGDINLAVENGTGGGQWTLVQREWNSGSYNSVTLRVVQDGGNITGDMIWDDVHLYTPAGTATETINITDTGTLRYYAQDAAGNHTGVTTNDYMISPSLPPVFTSTPITDVVEDNAYSYTATATDPESDPLTFSAPVKPPWSTFNPGNATLSGTPDFGDIGTYNVTLRVTDGFLEVDQDFTIDVSSLGNDAPVFTSIPVTNAITDELYTYTVIATDADGDSLTYSEVSLPSWLSFNSGARVLSGTPVFEDIGSYPVSISVYDGTVSVEQNFTIDVDTDNIPPVITSTPEVTVPVSSSYSYTFTATDADGDTLTYSAISIPAWLSFNPASRILSGTTAAIDEGGYNVILRVVDGEAAVDQSYTLLVGSPSGNLVKNASFESGTTYPSDWNISSGMFSKSNADSLDGSYSLRLGITGATDPASQTIALAQNTVYDISVSINAIGMNSGPVVFDTNDVFDNAGQGQFVINGSNGGWTQYTGSFNSGNNTSVTLRMFSEANFNGEVFYDDVSLTAQGAVNQLPTITTIPVLHAEIDVPYSYMLSATDGDGDPLTYSMVSSLSWGSFDPGSRLLTGTPSSSDAGSHPVTLRVSDGLVDVEQNFEIAIAPPPNQPPEWDSPILIKPGGTVDVMYTNSLASNVNDPDGDTLLFVKTGGPTWLGIAFNGPVNGTPLAGDEGLNVFTVTVSDGVHPPVPVSIEILVDGVTLIGYDAWADQQSAVIGSADIDYDGDGYDNLYEYALGGDPAVPGDDDVGPTVTKGAGVMEYVHRQRDDDPSLIYSVELCNDLNVGDWVPAGASSETNAFIVNYDKVKYDIPTTDEQSYIRLKITNP